MINAPMKIVRGEVYDGEDTAIIFEYGEYGNIFRTENLFINKEVPLQYYFILYDGFQRFRILVNREDFVKFVDHEMQREHIRRMHNLCMNI